MGRYYSDAKDTVESAQKIEFVWLKRQGFFDPNISFRTGNLTWSRNGEPTGNTSIEVSTSDGNTFIRFLYKSRSHWSTSDADWKEHDYKFPLEKLPCRYGGFKWFVRCQLSKNGVYCGRRVRVLYSINGYYGCRDCANLTYTSCQYGGRYKGFVSAPDLDDQLAKVKRTHYRGKPTRNYKKYLKMEDKFERGLMGIYASLDGIYKKKR
jgi:hypothetical protein